MHALRPFAQHKETTEIVPGIPGSSSGKRGKEPGVKDAPDLVLAAKIRPEPPVGPPFRENLIEKHIFLDTDIGTHGYHPGEDYIRAKP